MTEERASERARTVRAWLLGSLGLIALAMILLLDLAWPLKLGGWVLLTVLVDEFGGWFGYTAAAGGALPLLAALLDDGPALAAAPAEWTVLYPLVAAGLVAALLVKHTGGVAGLLLSLPLLIAPVLLARFAAEQLDPGVTLPADPRVLAWTFWSGLIGLALTVALRLLAQRSAGEYRLPDRAV